MEPKIKLWNSLDGSSSSLTRKENKRYQIDEGINGEEDLEDQQKPFVKS